MSATREQQARELVGEIMKPLSEYRSRHRACLIGATGRDYRCALCRETDLILERAAEEGKS